MKKDTFAFDQILQSTKGVKQTSVDISLFSEILDKAKTEQAEENSSLWLNSSRLKYIAAAVFLLATINIISMIKFSNKDSRFSKPNISEQLISDYNINR
ncbi:MAG: hypothetical protein WCP69_03870 [Bacteroidota bacterium]